MMLVFSGVITNWAPSPAALRISASAAARLGPTSGPALVCTQAIFTRAFIPAAVLALRRLGLHGRKSPGTVKRIKLVAAADMPAVDEDLRNRSSPACPALHLRAPLAVGHHIDLGIGRLAFVQQALCPDAIRAHHGGIDFDLRHFTPQSVGLVAVPPRDDRLISCL